MNKDHITLIKAFKYFLFLNKKKNSNFFLIIIGTGNLFDKLTNFIKQENLQNKIKILKILIIRIFTLKNQNYLF